MFIFLTINHSVGLEDPGFVNTTPLYTFIQNLLSYNVYRQHGMQANFTKNLTPLVEVINLMSHIWMQNYYSLNVPVIIKWIITNVGKYWMYWFVVVSTCCVEHLIQFGLCNWKETEKMNLKIKQLQCVLEYWLTLLL